MYHNHFFYYQKNFIGADGKTYLLDGVLGVKTHLSPHDVVRQWNRTYRGVSPAPYTLGKELSGEECKQIKDTSGRYLFEMSEKYHDSNHFACVIALTEIEEKN